MSTKVAVNKTTRACKEKDYGIKTSLFEISIPQVGRSTQIKVNLGTALGIISSNLKHGLFLEAAQLYECAFFRAKFRCAEKVPLRASEGIRINSTRKTLRTMCAAMFDSRAHKCLFVNSFYTCSRVGGKV